LPLTEGGSLSQYAIIDYLRKENDITLVLAAYYQVELDYANQLGILWPEVDIRVINLIPEKKQVSILGSLKRRLSHVFNSLDRRYVKKQATAYFDDLNSRDMSYTFETKPRLFIKELDEIFLSKSFDLVQVDFFLFSDLVHYFPEDIKKVLVHHELKTARLKTYLQARSIKTGPYEKYFISYMSDLEIHVLRKFDAIITFSQIDKDKLSERIDGSKVFVSPFPILDKSILTIKDEDLVIRKLVYVGGDGHFPNRDAVEWFIEEILPALTEKSGLTLHVIGNWNSETIKRYTENQSVKFVGFVEDLGEYCRNSIMVAPVRIGSGIRAKILNAMAQGTPVVSTTLGCEGIPVKHMESIMISDSVAEFIKSIAYLAEHPEFSKNMVINAQSIITKNYSQEVTGKLRQKYYQTICGYKNYEGISNRSQL
jgi:glycosyltransferase involved in cell wall biosynthesis